MYPFCWGCLLKLDRLDRRKKSLPSLKCIEQKNQKKTMGGGGSGVGFLDSLVGLIVDKDLSTLKHNLIIP